VVKCGDHVCVISMDDLTISTDGTVSMDDLTISVDGTVSVDDHTLSFFLCV
jgi:hypothetical protein